MNNALTPKATPKVIAEIRAEMARQAITQTQLARLLDMPLASLRRRLTGEASLLVDELFAIATALEIRAAVLVARAEAEPPAAVGGRGPELAQPPTAERNGQ